MADRKLLDTIKQAVEEGWTNLNLSDIRLMALPPEIGQLTGLQTPSLKNHTKELD